MKTRKKWAALAVVMFCGLVYWLSHEGRPSWQAYAASAPALPANVAGVWLNRPDALIRSESLTNLPRDLLTVPLLKDLLTEDFLFYYSTDEDWLGLKGTLRRIAYEHQLDLSDHIVSLLLDRPADVYVWRDGKGVLRHYALSIQRDLVISFAEKLAGVALKGDRQLRKLGEFTIGSAQVPVLALELSPRRSYVLLTFADRLVVLSSPDLVRKPDGDLDESFVAVATRWLSPDANERIGRFENHPLPGEHEARHSILLSSRFLSQGYAAFFPELAGLRFDFRQAGWSTQGLFNLPAQATAAAFDPNAWKHLPVHPSACALVPVRWSTLHRYLPTEDGFDVKGAQKVLAQLEPTGAVCWYDDARLYEPLLMATLKDKTGSDINASLAELFDWSINTSQDKSLDSKQKHRITVTSEDGATTWEREQAIADGSLNPVLVRAGKRLYFSASPALIERAKAMQNMRYPAVADTLTDPARIVLLHVEADRLSRLLETEIRDTVSNGSDDEMLVDQRIAPRLKALSRHGHISLVVAQENLRPGLGWQPLAWNVTTPQ